MHNVLANVLSGGGTLVSTHTPEEQNLLLRTQAGWLIVRHVAMKEKVVRLAYSKPERLFRIIQHFIA